MASDVFLSYSRKDQIFVHVLHDAFVNDRREAWIDWEDIPPTAKWLNEIYDAIDGADAFIFVLSPDSIISKTCKLEVMHAIENNKRLIPIVRRDVRPQDVDPLIAELNWIYFREQDDFSQAFKRLTSALDTDLQYVHQATRFLVRAREWETAKRNNNLTLRGPALIEAERWLAEGASKVPRPTTLQTRYITMSRRNTNTFQQRIIGGLSFGLILTLILSLVSYTNFLNAQEQTRQKNEQLQIAIERQLLAQSKTMLTQNKVDLAMLLSLQAFHVKDNNESRTNLWNALNYSPYLDMTGGVALNNSPTSNGAESSIALSADGKWLAGVYQHKIVVWNRETNITHLIPLVPPQIGFDIGTDCILSPDGKLVALSTTTLTQTNTSLQVVWIWNVEAGNLVAQLFSYPHEGVPSNYFALFSPNGKWLMMQGCADRDCKEGNQLLLWDVTVTKPATPRRMGSHLGLINSVAFSPDSSKFVSGGCIATCSQRNLIAEQGQMLLWDTETGQQLGPTR